MEVHRLAQILTRDRGRDEPKRGLGLADGPAENVDVGCHRHYEHVDVVKALTPVEAD